MLEAWRVRNDRPDIVALYQDRYDRLLTDMEWRGLKLPTEQDAVASDPPADEKQEE